MKKYLAILLCLLCSVFGCSSEKSAANKRVDVDLTAMSDTMAFAQASGIYKAPNTWRGKTIKVRGSYKVDYYDEGGKYYHFVLITGDACCQQGFEFIRNGAYTYPTDYPKEGAQIEIVGVFSHYTDRNRTFYYLDASALSVL